MVPLGTDLVVPIKAMDDFFAGTLATAQSASTDIKGIVWTELQKLPLASDPTKDER